MHIKRLPSWFLPDSAATPEHVFWNRRHFMTAAAGLGVLALAGCQDEGVAASDLASADGADPTSDLYPAARNNAFVLDRPVTDEAHNLTYNNFYEFGLDKGIYRAAQALPTRPWTVTIDGLVESPATVDIDQFIRTFSLEERLYRHRCVEAWSMAIPWTGIPLKDVVTWARPLSSARYIRFETFNMPEVALGQAQSWYSWPYVEGLTLAEATSELPLIVTGAYGKPVAKQMGAPLRLAVPWKYGFKSIKSIVRMTFTEERPVGFWEASQGSEYGFWANVNPEVPHPRWSQASERVLGTNERVPTLLYNGYGEQVAHLYKGLEGERLFM